MKRQRNDDLNLSQEGQRFELPNLSLRFFSYLIDLVLIFSIVSFALSFFKVFPVAFEIVARYELAVRPLLHGNLRQPLITFSIFFIIVSFVYYLFEPVLAGTIGKRILGLRTANLEGVTNKNTGRFSFSRRIIACVMQHSSSNCFFLIHGNHDFT